MKKTALYLLFLITVVSNAQMGGYTGFNSGTFENWTNSDESTTNIALEQSNSAGSSYYLRKTCDGTNSVAGEMAITNALYFQDNYINGSGAGMITFLIKNENPYDLHLRIGLTGFNGTQIVSTTPIIVPSSIGIWQGVSFHIPITQYYTIVAGSNTIEEVLMNVHKIKFIHNENISFDGAFVDGNLEIDEVGTVYLSLDDYTKKALKIYPVPTTDIINIQATNFNINQIELYDLAEKKMKIEDHNKSQIDISNFANGMYLLKIHSDNQVVESKIIVKQ